MRAALLLALIGAVLFGAAPSHALTPTPAGKAVLLGVSTPPPTVAGSFLAGTFSEKGVTYASFQALPGASFSRNSAAYAENATRSNLVLNSTMQGAVVGGAQPTGWTVTNNSNGLTWAVAGLSTQGSYSCIDERLFGTSTSANSAQIYFAPGTTIPAMPGQQFTGSEYGAVVAGSTANLVNINLSAAENNSGGSFLSGSSVNVVLSTSATLTRTTITKNVSNSAAAYKTLYLGAQPSGSGVAVDVTFRICAPQDEHGPTANGWIPTSGSAVTINDPAGYDLNLVYFPTRTNYLRNSTNVGANVGTNTLPTYLGMGTANNGITRTVAGFGTEFGLPYLDLNFSGTPASTFNFYLNLESAATIAAANGQAWTLSLSDRLLSGAPGNMSLGVQMQNSGGTGLGGDITQSIGAPGGLNRYALNATLNNASTSFVQPYIAFSFTSGTAYNFTVRLYGLFLEKQQAPGPVGGYPTAFIPTAGSVVSVNDMRITDLGFDKEDAATNLALFSQGAFSNASDWSMTSGVTATDNVLAAPDGTTTASQFNDGTAATAQHNVSTASGISVTSGTTYAASVRGKAGTNAFVQMTLANTQFSGLGYANFNLQNCSVTQTGGTLVGYGVLLYTNGWCEVWISATATATGSINPGPILVESGTSTRNPVFTGTGLTEYLWGYQVEQGTIPTSYCPSGSATCTRAADVAYIGGLPTLPAYTLAFKGLPRAISASVPQYLGMYDGGSDASRAYLAVSNTQHQAQLLSSGVNVYAGTTTGTTQAGVAGKVVASYAPGIQNMAAAGVLGTTSTGPAGALPGGFNRVDLGDNIGLTRPLNGYIQTFELDPYATQPAKLPGKTLH